MSFCPNCGFELKDNPKFCPECGFKLVKSNEITEDKIIKTSEDKFSKTEDKSKLTEDKPKDKNNYSIYIIGLIIFIVLLGAIFAFNSGSSDTTVSDLSEDFNDSNVSLDGADFKGAAYFVPPTGFELSNANEELANYDHDGLGHNIHMMVQQFDSLNEAISNMDSNLELSDENIYTFVDDKYGDVGAEEIFKFEGKYYLVSFYSMGGHAGSYMPHSLDDVTDGIHEFNWVNNIKPIVI